MSLNNEKKADIKCPSCKTYRYPSDFLNDKNRTLKTCKNCRANAKKMRDKKASKETTKDADDILQVLKDNTPLCEDVIGLIMDYTIPSKFEVGSVYSGMPRIADGVGLAEADLHHKVIKRTKCFIDVEVVGGTTDFYTDYRKYDRFKICLDDKGNECINKSSFSIMDSTYKIA